MAGRNFEQEGREEANTEDSPTEIRTRLTTDPADARRMSTHRNGGRETTESRRHRDRVRARNGLSLLVEPPSPRLRRSGEAKEKFLPPGGKSDKLFPLLSLVARRAEW